MAENIELVEKSVLGVMLLHNEYIADHALQPAMFAIPLHARIYQAMQKLRADERIVDRVMLMTLYGAEAMGGAEFLASLEHVANVEKFSVYAQLLLEAYRERRKQHILQIAQQENWSIPVIQEALDQAASYELYTDTSITEYVVSQLEVPFEPSMQQPAVTTGFQQLNQVIDGFKNGELTIVAARPSIGKTDLMNHFALQAAKHHMVPIIFSLEMSRSSLVSRFIANLGGYNRTKLRNPHDALSEQQKKTWSIVLNKLCQLGLQIDDRSNLSVEQVRAQTRHVMRKHPGKQCIVFIDYLQMMQGDPALNSTQSLGLISKGLKALAKDFACPVVCLAQLNRNVESRQSKRPVLSDIRDSGNIEQDADIVILLYRDSYYAEGQVRQLDRLEMNVAKNRNGPTGVVSAYYARGTGRYFEEVGK
ncbi:replicative DNA helicase [Lysinibacillus sp. LZ02]|uniref:replicative DNA helicase n=1 Tax=Lysinibacillus sp. LZ02 TaxID=3420668 RepID=UPI003D35EDE2